LKMGRVRDGKINSKDKFLLDQNHQKLKKITDLFMANLGYVFGNCFWKFSRTKLGMVGVKFVATKSF
jgi:hypothetical protein